LIEIISKKRYSIPIEIAYVEFCLCYMTRYSIK
jgi:hypothetical protein